MRRNSPSRRAARRGCSTGSTTSAAQESVVIWVERKPGALWAVGRAVNPQHRPSSESRRDDYLFEGYELSDALEAANAALEDDVQVLEADGAAERIKPFTRKEVLPVLERFFFGRR